jgi:hypothetical protein
MPELVDPPPCRSVDPKHNAFGKEPLALLASRAMCIFNGRVPRQPQLDLPQPPVAGRAHRRSRPPPTLPLPLPPPSSPPPRRRPAARPQSTGQPSPAPPPQPLVLTYGAAVVDYDASSIDLLSRVASLDIIDAPDDAGAWRRASQARCGPGLPGSSKGTRWSRPSSTSTWPGLICDAASGRRALSAIQGMCANNNITDPAPTVAAASAASGQLRLRGQGRAAPALHRARLLQRQLMPGAPPCRG